MLAQSIVGGLAAGSVYALVALGLALVYKTSRLVNFALGEMAMLSAFVAYSATSRLGLPYPAAFAVALAFAALLGLTVERVLIRRLQEAPHLSVVVVTLGLGSVLYTVAGWVWGYDTKTFPPPVSGGPLVIPLGAGLVLTRLNVLIFAVAVVLMTLVWRLIYHSHWGLGMRALVEQRDAASMLGVRPDYVSRVTWAIAAMLGAVAGMLIAPITFLDPNMMSDVVVKAFAAAVLGGLTSLPGAVVGGLAIGVLDNVVAQVWGTPLKATAAFAVIVVVLILRPTGLWGERD